MPRKKGVLSFSPQQREHVPAEWFCSGCLVVGSCSKRRSPFFARDADCAGSARGEASAKPVIRRTVGLGAGLQGLGKGWFIGAISAFHTLGGFWGGKMRRKAPGGELWF